GDEPEGADEEGALFPGEAVVSLFGAVAQDEPVVGELVRDRVDRRAQTFVLAREEAEDRRQENGGVERVGRVVLAEDSTLADAVGEDVGLDLLRGRAPALDELGVPANLGEARGPVE